MASFVESATLVVKDKSTAQINKINAALKSLFSTARNLKSIKVNVQVTGVERARQQVQALARDLKRLRDVNVRVRAATGQAARAAAAPRRPLAGAALASYEGKKASLARAALITKAERENADRNAKIQAQAARQAAREQAQATRQAVREQAQLTRQHLAAANRQAAMGGGSVPMVIPGRSTRPWGQVQPAPPRGGGGGGGGGRGGAVAAGLRGLLSGSGAGIGGMYGSFMAVTAAGHLAAAALRSVAENAAARDRTTLQSAVAASKAQREVFEKAGDRPEGAGPISFTKDERDRMRTSLLGDVAGGETERAGAAVNITKMLETSVLPRLFAQSPDKSRPEVLEGLRKIVQGINLASTDIVDKSGNFSDDGIRALRGIQKAMAADPEISPALVRSSLANLKTAGYTLSEDSIARVLINAGTRGVRAANEAFQAMRSSGGEVDVKALNDSLENLGLISGGKRKGPKGDKALQAGTSNVKEAQLWAKDPAEWFYKHYTPKMEEKVKATGVQEGTTEWTVARKNQIQKDFAGMRSAGVQGITDMILGYDQMKSTLAQANLSMDQRVSEAAAKSWAAQGEAVKVAWIDAAAGVGQAIAEKINLTDILSGVAEKLRDSPGLSIAAAGIGTAIVGAVGVGMGTAMLAPSAALTGSAGALTGSAGALTEAAVALGAKGAISTAGETAAGAVKSGAVAGAAATIASTAIPAAIAAGAAYAGYKMAEEVAKPENAGKTPYEKLGFDKTKLDQMLPAWAKTAPALDKQISELTQTQRALADAYQKREALDRVPAIQSVSSAIEAQKSKLDVSISDLAAKIGALSSKAIMSQAGEYKPAAAPSDWKPTPPPLQPANTQWPDPTAISSAAEAMKAAMDGGGQQISSAASTLSASTGTFQSVFATGAQAIGQSGQLAASTLQGAAPGIGSSIGNTAAAAIRAAVANISVNVNTNGAGGKQGNPGAMNGPT